MEHVSHARVYEVSCAQFGLSLALGALFRKAEPEVCPAAADPVRSRIL